jgi:ABC-type antimicrobial peptide transport system permease subunit
MTLWSLVRRSATYHWRTNLAVCLGVAASVSVLGGALIVGDSVRDSLRDLALGRLGRTGDVVSSGSFVREGLTEDLARSLGRETAPLLSATAVVTHEPSGRRASNVFVYGVDERFWRFHGLAPHDGAFASPALAAELGAVSRDVLLTRLQKPSEIPLESLFAHKEDVGRTVRLTLSGILDRDQLGEFTLRPQQGDVRAIFAPLTRIQRDLDAKGRVNTFLVADGSTGSQARDAFRSALRLEDLGVRVAVVKAEPALAVESASGIVSEPLESAAAAAAGKLGLNPAPVFTYLANTIRVAGTDRQIPYSLVSAVDMGRLPKAPQPMPSRDATPAARTGSPIALNTWAVRELAAAVGDAIELEYYLWDAQAGLQTRTARFVLDRIVPIEGLAADRELAPDYPGISGADSLADWDPPFPIDLSRVRPQDERYWTDFRTTPKAFVPYELGRDLWSTQFGRATSIRLPVPEGGDAGSLASSLQQELERTLDPGTLGVSMIPVRQMALAASGGATDFGEYFTYFSFFLVVSALLLAVMFFRLGVEQRLRQVGILRASGFTIAQVRRLLLTEAGALAVVGSAAGAAGAVGYAHAIVYGLRTWWIGAVGTTLLTVHVRPLTVALGAAGGIIAALVCVWLALRTVGKRSPRSLLGAQSLDAGVADGSKRTSRYRAGFVLFVTAGLPVAAAFAWPALQVGLFFGAGALLLTASLTVFGAWLRSRNATAVRGRGAGAISRLGFRGAAFRPVRSVLVAALIASAAFIIVAVDAFRRGGGELTGDPKSGTGGFALMARSEVPILYNPNDPAGRKDLQLDADPALADVRFMRFRIRPGDDASCLNLYRPSSPTLIAPERSFVEANRFSFAATIPATEDERANPWRLLDRRFADGAIPAIADATSLQYVLHAAVGDELAIDAGGGAPLTLRIVGALRDSVLQSELVIGEPAFVRLFPSQQGFRYFLVEAPRVATREEAGALAESVERALAPFGVDAVGTVERLDSFHRVENTYLSTFQALGALGLLLGTVGLATVMLRNVLERRKEMALLRAVGYDARHVTAMMMAEAALLLAAGLGVGVVCALLAIAPAWMGRGGSAPGSGLALLLVAIVAAGLVSALGATRAALRGSLLEALRSE